MLGLSKHIHFHTSRHTFATRALRMGMRIEYVSKILDGVWYENYKGFKLRDFNDENEEEHYDNLCAENNIAECLMTHKKDEWNTPTGVVNSFRSKGNEVIEFDFVRNTEEDLRIPNVLDKIISEVDFVMFLAFDVGNR